MEKAASVVAGMSIDEELRMRQKAAACIQDLTEALNANVKDQEKFDVSRHSERITDLRRN